MSDISDLQLDDTKFVDLLGKLIGEAKHLQNNPPEFVPTEDRGERRRARLPSPLYCYASDLLHTLTGSYLRPCASAPSRPPSRHIPAPSPYRHATVLLLASAPLPPSATFLRFLAAARHVLDVLRPLSTEEGGPLLVQHVSFVEGRGNIIVEVSEQCTLAPPPRHPTHKLQCTTVLPAATQLAHYTACSQPCYLWELLATAWLHLLFRPPHHLTNAPFLLFRPPTKSLPTPLPPTPLSTRLLTAFSAPCSYTAFYTSVCTPTLTPIRTPALTRTPTRTTRPSHTPTHTSRHTPPYPYAYPYYPPCFHHPQRSPTN